MKTPNGFGAPWLLLGILACGTDAASPTPRDLDDGGPRLEAAVVSVPSASWSFSFTPVNSRDDIGPTSWGPFFTYPALLRLVATGFAMAQCIWPNCGPAVGPFKAANAFPYLGIGITVTSSLGPNIGWGEGSDTTYGGGHGAMAARWETGPGDIHQPYCDQVATPCYNYDGGTISVAVFKPPIQVTFFPDADTVAAQGMIAEFQVTFSPTTFEGRLMNFGVARWTFKPDNGIMVTVCGMQNPCRFVPSKSGDLYADVIAQGDSMRFTGRVNVPCPPLTGDTLITKLSVREGFVNELALSRPNPDGTNRVERFGYLVKRNGQVLVHNQQVTASECHNIPVAPTNLQPGDTVLAMYHTHPSLLAEPYNSAGCIPNGLPNPFGLGGGSLADWALASSPNWGGFYPMYVVAYAGVVSRLDFNTPPAAQLNNPNRWFHHPTNPNVCPVLL